MISFTVYGEAQSQGSKTVGRLKSGQTYVRESNPNLAEWRRQVRQAAGEAMVRTAETAYGEATAPHEPIFGPVILNVVFYRSRPAGHYGTGRNAGKLKASADLCPTSKPDVLKLARAIEDALSGICFRDDAQVVSLTARKAYGNPPRAEVDVRPFDP